MRRPSCRLHYFSIRGFQMFQRMIDDFKECTGTALRLTSLAAAVALALLVTIVVSVRGRLCLRAAELWPGPGLPDRRRVFFVVTLIAAGCYMVRKNRVKARAAESREIRGSLPARRSHADCDRHPVVRAIGVKRLIPFWRSAVLRWECWQAAAPPATKRPRADRISPSSGHAAARLELLGHFGQYADHGLAGHRRLARRRT